MGSPAEQILLVDRDGSKVQLDALLEKYRGDARRVLADDEVGIVLYVGDLGFYQLKPTGDAQFLAQPVTEISRPRFSTRFIRKQIGATVLTVTADAVFVVRDGDVLRKLRAEKLEAGMTLASGEKVYQ